MLNSHRRTIAKVKTGGFVGMAEYSYILGSCLIIIHGCAATFAALTLGISKRNVGKKKPALTLANWRVEPMNNPSFRRTLQPLLFFSSASRLRASKRKGKKRNEFARGSGGQQGVVVGIKQD